MRVVVLAALAVFAVSGCCAFSSRSCYPACPPPKIIEVSKCKLPDPVSLPGYTRTVSGCPTGLNCFDDTNMFNIIRRDTLLKQWIQEAKRRCSPPASAPSTQPTN